MNDIDVGALMGIVLIVAVVSGMSVLLGAATAKNTLLDNQRAAYTKAHCGAAACPAPAVSNVTYKDALWSCECVTTVPVR